MRKEKIWSFSDSSSSCFTNLEAYRAVGAMNAVSFASAKAIIVIDFVVFVT